MLLLIALLLLFPTLHAQDAALHTQQQTVMFYNLENAFWPEDDPTKQDDDFTPTGTRRWSKSRLNQKLTQVEKVLLGAGNGLAPMVVGLAEVEGDSVINYWLQKTSLRQLRYKAVLSDSADSRGILTALLYQPSEFRLLSHESHSVTLPNTSRTTRQLLHVAGRLVSGDTLDLIVCHLPSQYSGAKQSQASRDAAHRTLMHLADSIVQLRHQPYVIIMGDMNEAPSKRHDWWNQHSTHQWSNLMLPLQQQLLRRPGQYGTHKYQGEWTYLDQFIVSSTLQTPQTPETPQTPQTPQTPETLQPPLKPHPALPRLRLLHPRSFSMPFMLTADETHLGQRPKRSYYGSQYEGGVSDHLPIIVDLEVYF